MSANGDGLKDWRTDGRPYPVAAPGTGHTLGRFLPFPLQLLVVLTVLIFSVEALIMVIMGALPDMPLAEEAILDAVLLSAFVFPLLYQFSFRPLLRHIAERRVAEQELRDLQEHLQQLVDEKTRDLQTTNEQLVAEMAVRKQIQRHLVESEQMAREVSRQLYALLDANEDIILFLDADARIKWSNRSASRFLGTEPARLTGAPCKEVLDAAGIPWEGGVIEKSLAMHTGGEDRTKASGDRIIDLRTFPVPDEKKSTHELVVVGTDVTEKLKLQEEAVRKSHLASIGELAAGVAHEINNPINVIINYAQLIQNRLGKGSGEAGFAEKIMGEGDRIAAIVESLLSFARRQSPEYLLVSVGEVVEETLVLTTSQFRKEKIRLSVDVPRDLPRVKANSQHLKQVFLNLIHNARHALNRKFPQGDSNKILDIRGETLKTGNSEVLRLTFTDYGSGISPQVLDHVMKPFFTTKPVGEGTGLGLSICHGIIEGHGGRLTVESSEGEYTTVAVELPLGDASIRGPAVT